MEVTRERGKFLTQEVKDRYAQGHAEGISILVVRDRIKSGMTLENAVTTPRISSGSAGYPVPFRNITFKCITDACVNLKISRTVVDKIRAKYKGVPIDILFEALYRVKQLLPDPRIVMTRFPKIMIGNTCFYSYADMRKALKISARDYYSMKAADDFTLLVSGIHRDDDYPSTFVNYEKFFDGLVKQMLDVTEGSVEPAELVYSEVIDEDCMDDEEEIDIPDARVEPNRLSYYADTFIRLARSEYKSVEYYNSVKDYRHCCISGSLTCEYYLKALFSIVIPHALAQHEFKSHLLKVLAVRLVPSIPKLSDITLDLQTLTSYYNSMRYPGPMYYDADKEDSDLSYSTTVTVKELVEQYMIDNS